MSTSVDTGSSAGWRNILGGLLFGTYLTSGVFGALFFVDFVESHASRPKPAYVTRDQRPDIRHCFQPDAPKLWECITHKEPKP